MEKLAVEYHDTLNPKIWDGDTLKPAVLKQLRKISDKFIAWLNSPEIKIKDIVITGSGANYNWDASSDIDIHILIDLKEFKSKCHDFAHDFFDVKNKRFKEVFPITVYGMSVEITVEDESQGGISEAVYSIKRGEWVKKPKYNPPDYDENKAKKISNDWKKKMLKVMKKPKASYDELEGMRDDLKDYRRKSLEKGGEYDEGNIAFKDLRRRGIVDKMKAQAQKALSRDLSLKK